MSVVLDVGVLCIVSVVTLAAVLPKTAASAKSVDEDRVHQSPSQVRPVIQSTVTEMDKLLEKLEP